VPRVNLITNPSFKTNTTGWTATGSSTLSRVTTDYFYGDSCLQVAKAAAVNSGASATAASASAGTVYTASVYVRVPDNQEDAALTVYVDWYNVGASVISTVSAGPTSLTDLDGWVRLAVTGTAPTGTVSAVLRVNQPTAGTAGQTFLVDAALFEASSFAGQYLDELTQSQENTTMDQVLKRVPVPHLTGAELNGDVALGSLVFNTVDEYGVVWVITQVEGWWNLPTPTMPSIERGFADGSYDVRGRFESRAITLSGVILPPDRTKLPAARERLLSAANLVYRGDWLRLDEGPVKACWVRLVGQPTIDTVNPRGRTEFSLQLRASDPVKYEYVPNDADGKRVTTLPVNNKLTLTETTATVTNSGNTDVTAVFEVTGPLYGPNASIENLTTGQAMTVVGSLRPLRTFVVTGRATDLDGVSTVTLTTARHNIRIGDEVAVSGTGVSGYNGTWTATAVGSTTVSYYTGLAFESTVSSLTGALVADADVLEIDTYDREVALNGLVEGARSQLDTLTDWTYLKPGPNQIAYYDDSQSPTFIKSYSRDSAKALISTLGDNDFYPFDSAYVATPSTIATSAPVQVLTTATVSTVHLPDLRGVVSSTLLGPVVYTDTRAQAVGAVAWNTTTKTVTLQTEFDHGMVVGDYLTVDGGNVSPVGGVNIGVATATPVSINTYAFNTTTDVLTIVTASSTGYTLGDEIEIYNLGGDFDGVFGIASISGSTITANVVSTNVTFTTTSAPSEAAVRRVYRVASVTNNSLTYVKKSGSGTTFTVTAVTPMAGRMYPLGVASTTVAYRSGWIS
jgi:hypothetical protein